VLLQVEHCPIARDDYVDIAGGGAFENAIVGLVVSHGEFFARTHQFSQL